MIDTEENSIPCDSETILRKNCLEESPDLNEYNAPGIYILQEIKGNPTNFPFGLWTGSPFGYIQLEVRAFYENNKIVGVHQTLYQRSSNNVWVRYCEGDPALSANWSEWGNLTVSGKPL